MGTHDTTQAMMMEERGVVVVMMRRCGEREAIHYAHGSTDHKGEDHPFFFFVYFFLVFTLLLTRLLSFLPKSQPQRLHIFVCSRRSHRCHMPCRMETQHSFLLLPISLEEHHEQDLVPSVQGHILPP